MAPDSAVPAALAYRGSLVALGLASLVAIFLIVNPPQDGASVDEGRSEATNTPVFEATATATPSGAGAQPTTTIATPTPPVEPTPADGEGDNDDDPGETTTYTVQPGDSLISIAGDHGVSVDDIIAANGDIPDENSPILAGQEITIPAP